MTKAYFVIGSLATAVTIAMFMDGPSFMQCRLFRNLVGHFMMNF